MQKQIQLPRVSKVSAMQQHVLEAANIQHRQMMKWLYAWLVYWEFLEFDIAETKYWELDHIFFVNIIPSSPWIVKTLLEIGIYLENWAK